MIDGENSHPSKNQLTPFASRAEQRSGMNVVATRSSTNASPHRVPPPERGAERPRLGAGADLRAWDIAAGAPRRTTAPGRGRWARRSHRSGNRGAASAPSNRSAAGTAFASTRRRTSGPMASLPPHCASASGRRAPGSRAPSTSSAEPSGRAWPWTRCGESRLWRQRCGATLFKW